MFAVLALCLTLAAAGSRAHLEASVTTAQIGEPFVLSIVVEHPTNATVTLPDPNALPRAFALVEDLGLRRETDPQASDRTTTRARWRVLALEGGDAVLPGMRVQVESGGKSEALEVETVPLTIAHALHEGEDAPRPSKGFRPAPVVHAVSARALIVSIGTLVVLAVVGVVLWRRARRKPAPVAAASPLERLVELERQLAAEPESARDVTFALTTLVRRAVDRHIGQEQDPARQALTDADWAQATADDERVPQATRLVAAKLLRSAERVKYAVETPSILGLRETFAEARVALEALTATEKVAA